jgi:uncharacterized repeat protein (TIGR01451 family)
MRFPEFHFLKSHIRLPALWILVLLVAPQISWAAGTSAGTAISNTVTLSYSLGASPQSDIPASSIPFLVDEKINLTVVGGVTTNVLPGSTAQATAFTVSNNSNSALDFALTVTNVIGGDQFNPSLPCTAYVESGATAGYQSGQDTATFIDELAPDATKTVYAVCDIPAAANNDTGLVGLTATARGDFTGANGSYAATAGSLGAVITQTAGADTPGTVDIVFADSQGTDDGASPDAKHSARNTYQIAGAGLTVTKTASVLDLQGGSVVMPTSVITYQIAVNLGGGTVTGLVITDPLPAETTYVSTGTGSITITCISGTYTGGGACGIGTITTPQPLATKTDSNLDADFADFTGNIVTVSLGDVTGPADFIITFKATIK